MKEKICYLVHTEYHLLLSINDAMDRYGDHDKYDITIILKRSVKGSRLKQEFDFSSLPYNFIFLDLDINLYAKLKPSEKEQIDAILAIKFSTFIIFQEHDPICIILLNRFVENGAQVYLFQDGLKAYTFNSMKGAYGLIRNNLKENRWIKMNGYPVKDYFSFLRCRKYAFLKEVNKVFVTFPEAYDNWNKKSIGTLKTIFSEEFKAAIKKVFKWDDSLLPEKENVIFFMNQPLKDDGAFEMRLLKELSNKYPDKKLFIKLHPLTSASMLERYKELENVTVIHSKVPAEIFISEMKNSVIISFFSGSMFIDNETSKYYWLHSLPESQNLKNVKKVKIINPTKHIVSVKQIDEIVF